MRECSVATSLLKVLGIQKWFLSVPLDMMKKALLSVPILH